VQLGHLLAGAVQEVHVDQIETGRQNVSPIPALACLGVKIPGLRKTTTPRNVLATARVEGDVQSFMYFGK